MTHPFNGFLFTVISVLVCSGCQTLQVKNTKAAPVASEVSSVDVANNYILTRLPESELPDGKCGMILWTLEENLPAPVFQYLSGDSGRISLNGKTIKLFRQTANGATAFGVSEQQSFLNEAGDLKVSVDTRIGLGFDGGAYLERGLIALENNDGWRTVTPVAGITGCRT